MKIQQIIKFFPVMLFCYHLLFAYVGWDYVLHHQGDASKYWLVGEDLSNKSWFSFFQPGTDIVKILTFPLVKYFHLPFWAGFVLFSAFSYIGFYQLWIVIRKTASESRMILLSGMVLLVLPNLHVWTSLIGKESLLFVALTTMIWTTVQVQTKWIPLALSVLVIAFIRPHVAFIVVLSLVIALLWKAHLSLKQKGFVLLMTSTVFVGLYGMLGKITYLGEAPWSRLIYIYEYHIAGLKKTAAYVPLDQYPLPVKIFTFYFRPLPFEKEGWLYQIWSFENAFLLVICSAFAFIVMRNFKKIHWGFLEIFSIFIIVLLSLMYVYAYANYGMIARTKIMAMPFLYVLLLSGLQQIAARNKLLFL